MKFILSIVLFFLVFSSFGGTWNQRSNFGGSGRHRATGISIFNKGYLGLGHVNGSGIDISYKDWWEYDPASNSWTQKANYPVTNHGAVAFSIDKKGYVGGGSALNGEFYCFDPALNTWTPIASCPLFAGDTQGFSVQEKGYVYSNSQLAEFNPSTNSWSMKPDAPISFSAWSCSFSSSGSGFIKTGNILYEFKPSQNQWIQRANFPGQMSNGSSAFSIQDKGYVTCGYVGGLSTVTDEVWEFNSGNNTWLKVDDFPGINRRFPVAFAINDKGYFGTGTNGINMNDFWQYDPFYLSLDELSMADTDWTVYPNPANDYISIHFNSNQHLLTNQVILEIVGIDGKIHQKTEVDAFELTINQLNFPSGIYIIRLLKDDQLLSQKRLTFL